MVVWHYTKGINFVGIVEDGFIAPTTINLEPSELPAVWFSANQDWELTAAPAGVVGLDDQTRDLARRGLLSQDALTRLMQEGTVKLASLSIDQTHDKLGGAFRFGVDSRQLLHWTQLIRIARISPRKAMGLANAARVMGSDVALFYGTTQPVPVEECCSVERWDKKSQHWTQLMT